MLTEVSQVAAIIGALQSGNADAIRAVLIDTIQQYVSIRVGAGDSDQTITNNVMTIHGAAIGGLAAYAKLEQIVHNTAVVARKLPGQGVRVRP